MNKTNFGLIALMALTLFGCGDFKKPLNDNGNNIEERQLNVERKLLVESETLTKELSLGKLDPTSTLEISLMGTKITPHFTDIFDQVHQSKWSKRYCVSDNCKTCTRFVECFDEEITGQCTHRYRERLEDQETQLLFNKSPLSISAKIRIGQKTYPIESIVENQESVLIAKFQLTKEMLSESNEVFLTVDPEPSQGNVQIGFLGLGQCNGIGKTSFTSGGPTSSSQVTVQERIEYRVSVTVETPQR